MCKGDTFCRCDIEAADRQRDINHSLNTLSTAELIPSPFSDVWKDIINGKKSGCPLSLYQHIPRIEFKTGKKIPVIGCSCPEIVLPKLTCCMCETTHEDLYEHLKTHTIDEILKWAIEVAEAMRSYGEYA